MFMLTLFPFFEDFPFSKASPFEEAERRRPPPSGHPSFLFSNVLIVFRRESCRIGFDVVLSETSYTLSRCRPLARMHSFFILSFPVEGLRKFSSPFLILFSFPSSENHRNERGFPSFSDRIFIFFHALPYHVLHPSSSSLHLLYTTFVCPLSPFSFFLRSLS